jgi:hypothetical protein
MAALSRVDSYGKTLPDFFLYIDEFQNISTDSISSILSEARKYGLSLNIAHQFIAQLEPKIKDAVFGNVGSMAVFRVGAEDAQFLESQFAPVFKASDIMKIENHNAYLKLLINGKPVPPFNVETMAPPAGRPEIVDSIKSLSYLKFGKDRKSVDDAIMKKYLARPDASAQGGAPLSSRGVQSAAPLSAPAPTPVPASPVPPPAPATVLPVAAPALAALTPTPAPLPPLHAVLSDTLETLAAAPHSPVASHLPVATPSPALVSAAATLAASVEDPASPFKAMVDAYVAPTPAPVDAPLPVTPTPPAPYTPRHLPSLDLSLSASLPKVIPSDQG